MTSGTGTLYLNSMNVPISFFGVLFFIRNAEHEHIFAVPYLSNVCKWSFQNPDLTISLKKAFYSIFL